MVYGSICGSLQVFEELLLDADWSVNAGSWMWLSCSAFFQQFFHCYCPVGFGRRTDPSGDYIRYTPAQTRSATTPCSLFNSGMFPVNDVYFIQRIYKCAGHPESIKPCIQL